MDTPSSIDPVEEGNFYHVETVEPRLQLKRAGWWLVINLGCIFLISLAFDLAVVFLLPLALIGAAASGVLLVRLGFSAAKEVDSRGVNESVARWSGIASVGLFVALFVPALRAGDYCQAQLVLRRGLQDYRNLIFDPNPARLDLRSHYAQFGGTAPNRIWAFSYGGFLSIDKSIVYDPLDNPEVRSTTFFHAQDAQCSWLKDHFYNCTLSY